MSKGYNTNLAAEYYVLSMLYRKSFNAYLTLGNKKSVDIIVESGRNLATIDVKGIAGTTLWPMDNFTKKTGRHFIVFVTFLNKIGNHGIAPEAYVVPSKDVERLLYRNPKKTRKGINVATLRRHTRRYKDRWDKIG